MVADNDQQWIQGKVFGFSFVETNWNIVTLWPAGVWNSVCITTSTEVGGDYRVNINGQIVLQTRNRENIFKTQKAGFVILTVFKK